MINSESLLENEINELKGDISSYASLVENMLFKSINGIFSKDTNILNEVIFRYEPRANDAELEIDEKCISMIAKYSPKASSLRLIQSIMKINLDLERMADHTVNISREGIDLLKISPIINENEIFTMASETLEMFRKCIKSFLEANTLLADYVCSNDNIIDDFKKSIEKNLILKMTNDNKIIGLCIHYISIIRNLERIADLSTNIAENTIFAIKGKSIKHSYK